MILKILCGVAFLCYLSVAVLASLPRGEKRAGLVTSLEVLGAACSASAVLVNFIANGYVPFVSMYQVLIFLTFSFTLIHLLLRFVYRRDLTPFVYGMAAVTAFGCVVMDGASVWHFAPALRSPFFVPHVFCYMLAYTLAAVAAAVCVRDMLQKKDPDDSVACVRVLYPFMTAGLFLGCLWANEVWGAFWSWDVKENWSLFTWLCFTTVLHLRGSRKEKGAARLLILAGFLGVIVTFLFVNFMNASSLHTYS